MSLFLLISPSLCAETHDPIGLVETEVKVQQSAAAVLYEDFHRHPELAFHERRTAEKVAAWLGARGFKITERVGGFGVAGVLKNGEGPVLWLRVELDALPIGEKTSSRYKSLNPNVMHACGHDAHLAMVLSSAAILNRMRKFWSGTLVVFAQSAEETLEGAKAALADSKMKSLPKGDFILGAHTRHENQTGEILFKVGPITFYADNVDIIFHGSPGYITDEEPEALTAAADFVDRLKQRRIQDKAEQRDSMRKVGVGAIHGGVSYNVRPEEATVKLTLRNQDASTRAEAIAELQGIANKVAHEAGLKPPQFNVQTSVPPIQNSEKLAQELTPIFKQLVGPDKVLPLRQLSGAEDFSLYGGAQVQQFYFFLGSSDPARPRPWPQNHGPYFTLSFDKTYRTGTSALVLATLHLLKATK